MPIRENIDGLPGARTQDYVIRREYFRKEGLYQMAVAGDGEEDDECVFVRLHSPYEWLEIHWGSVKDGAPPLCPHAFDLDDNHVFLGQGLGGNAPMPLGQGQNHTWIVSGVYYYGLVKVRPIGGNLATGRYPFDGHISPNEAIIPAGNFVGGLLTAPPSTQGWQNPIPRLN